MRINVYTQELTNDLKVIEKKGNDGALYSAIMLMLHSSDRLHQPPDHVGDDDDRSAVTFWLPRSPERREAFAKLLESAAQVVRTAKPEKDSNVIENTVHDLADPEISETGKKILALSAWLAKIISNDAKGARDLLPTIFSKPQEELDAELSKLEKQGLLSLNKPN